MSDNTDLDDLVHELVSKKLSIEIYKTIENEKELVFRFSGNQKTSGKVIYGSLVNSKYFSEEEMILLKKLFSNF